MKEALKEWLDEKYTAFGKYSFFGLGGFILSAFIYFILTTNGWRPPV
jgi:putative flippase GtrA